jgi:uncharacterized membrane protein HdeD (DUF308 family)
MPILLATAWWSLLIRGLAALTLGTAAFVWQEISTYHLALVFCSFAMIDGVVNLVGAVTVVEPHEHWTPLVLEGVSGIAAAQVAGAWPGVTLIGLMYIIAVWGLTTGILVIASAIKLRKVNRGDWMLALNGAASLILGIVMAVFPLARASTVAIWLGIYAFVFGALLLGLAVQQRARIGHRLNGSRLGQGDRELSAVVRDVRRRSWHR